MNCSENKPPSAIADQPDRIATPSAGIRDWRCWIVVIGALACLIFRVSGVIALGLGLAVSLLIGNPIPESSQRMAHKALQWAVIGLGAGMDLGVAWRVGIAGLGYTAVGITFALGFGCWLGKRLGLEKELALLISAGTAICGGSAIAALSATIKPHSRISGAALATVFLFNAVALLIFPLLGHSLGFSQHQFGLWAALAIHDTSSVVGAGSAYGDEALILATTVKLARALWIIPLVLGVGCLGTLAKQKTSPNGIKIPIPVFLIGFVLMAALFTLCPTLSTIQPWIVRIASHLLGVALFLIGTGLTYQAIKQAGIRPLLQGFLLWVCIATGTAAAIYQGWIS